MLVLGQTTAQAYYTDHYILILSILSYAYVHITGPVPTVDEVSLQSLFFILRSTLYLYPVLFINEYTLVLSIPM